MFIDHHKDWFEEPARKHELTSERPLLETKARFTSDVSIGSTTTATSNIENFASISRSTTFDVPSGKNMRHKDVEEEEEDNLHISATIGVYNVSLSGGYITAVCKKLDAARPNKKIAYFPTQLRRASTRSILHRFS